MWLLIAGSGLSQWKCNFCGNANQYALEVLLPQGPFLDFRSWRRNYQGFFGWKSTYGFLFCLNSLYTVSLYSLETCLFWISPLSFQCVIILLILTDFHSVLPVFIVLSDFLLMLAGALGPGTAGGPPWSVLTNKKYWIVSLLLLKVTFDHFANTSDQMIVNVQVVYSMFCGSMGTENYPVVCWS